MQVKNELQLALSFSLSLSLTHSLLCLCSAAPALLLLLLPTVALLYSSLLHLQNNNCTLFSWAYRALVLQFSLSTANRAPTATPTIHITNPHTRNVQHAVLNLCMFCVLSMLRVSCALCLLQDQNHHWSRAQGPWTKLVLFCHWVSDRAMNRSSPAAALSLLPPSLCLSLSLHSTLMFFICFVLISRLFPQ